MKAFSVLPNFEIVINFMPNSIQSISFAKRIHKMAELVDESFFLLLIVDS